jgi:hypothetical protein
MVMYHLSFRHRHRRRYLLFQRYLLEDLCYLSFLHYHRRLRHQLRRDR